MSDTNAILVPAGFGEAEFTEKRSRFIGRVWPVTTEDEAIGHIKAMREQHWDATHNVYAYIVRESGAMRYSDDGEPQGTSGMPVLEVFRKSGVTDFCCVVTRYFGGILLGAGGLVRAYSQAASLALNEAGLARLSRWRSMTLACPYALYERVRAELESSGGVIEDTDFAADVTLRVLVEDDASDACIARITDLTSGAVVPQLGDTSFRAVPLS